MNKILVVEDDSVLSYSIEYTLKNDGFEVISAANLAQAKKAYIANMFDLILLDIKLPDGTGYEFCTEIRKLSRIPIIFLTACDEETNIVTGLDMGADDYITKPFRIKELISRIGAVLRRNITLAKAGDILYSGELSLHVLQGKVRKNDTELVITALEYRLLLAFMKNPKQVLSRNGILQELWDIEGAFIDDNSLSVYIRRLREKIEEDPGHPIYILTNRGMGYSWNCEVRRG
ncbi:MAG TPA: response regulator transcription factor [Clostridiaceae bacterium]